MVETFKQMAARLTIATVMMIATYAILASALTETAAFVIAFVVFMLADLIIDQITPGTRGEEDG